jgi:para-aminobenzoate synthetase
MRTLLIDNHDSFTHNLYHLLTVANGCEPVVLANDARGLSGPGLSGFDSIVISPGPGHPGRLRDFGHAGHVLATATVPVLGVCLGHQGIAACAGAAVVPAPRARHGYLSRIGHGGRGLFRGLPQGFTAVRYHSLCVAGSLPPELEVTARAEDGVIMGIGHRDRPLWGVQFHPESVQTQLGRELVANFGDLAREYHATRPRPVATLSPPASAARVGDQAAVRSPRVNAARPARFGVAVRKLGFAVDAEAAFTRLFAASPRAFWLDSALARPGLARFSYLGDGSGPYAEFVTYRAGGGVLEVRASTGPRRAPGGIFGYLQRELRDRVIEAPALPFGFCGGYVGYFGYELKADCGSPGRHRAATPDACWLFADRLVVVDHEQDEVYLLALHDRSAATVRAAAAWLDSVAGVLSCLSRTVSTTQPRPATPAAAGLEAAPVAGLAIGEQWLARGRERYLADVAACQRALRAGESYEICLTNTLRLPAVGDGYAFYRRLRRLNPAPYAAYLRCDGVEVACSSPERFLKVSPGGLVEAKPVKGTAPRGDGPGEDERLRDALAADPKNLAENLIITDLLRNDLSRVCEPGSVHVPKLAAVESYPAVHHLVSTVRGRLRRDADAIDCARACFPGGSMTGAPKLRTMEIIDALEDQARGIYSGAIGYLSGNGCADLNIVIRTAVLAGGEWQIGAGGAVVLDSDAEAEYREMLLKAGTVLRARPAGAFGRCSAARSDGHGEDA